jgi:hypothetical protein
MFDTSNQLEGGPADQTLPLTAPALNDALSREHPGISRLASHAAGGPRPTLCCTRPCGVSPARSPDKKAAMCPTTSSGH